MKPVKGVKGCEADPGRMPIVDALVGGEVLIDFGDGIVRLTDEQARELAASIELELTGEAGKRARMRGLRRG